MKFSPVLLSNVFLAITFAAPTPEAAPGLLNRVQRREAQSHQSLPKQIAPPNGIEGINSDIKKAKNIDYSSNWSGAVIKSPPTGQTFNAVSATFTVPGPAIPAGVASNGSYAASAWVGIDGDTYSNAILQTGIDFSITKEGDISFDAWYEWFPDYAFDFPLSVSAGDVITLSVSASTSTSGTATVENLTTGLADTIDLTSTSALGGQNAEWIVEDFMVNGALVPLANFGTVNFEDCVASTGSQNLGPGDATVIEIENSNGVVLTGVEIVSESAVHIVYSG
jgi:hypothetical protein